MGYSRKNPNRKGGVCVCRCVWVCVCGGGGGGGVGGVENMEFPVVLKK